MRPPVVIVLFFFVVFVGGGLLAPAIHATIQTLAQSVPAFEGLAREEFRRYVTRSWMIVGVVCLWPALRALNQASWQANGLKKQAKAPQQLTNGLMLGFATLALAALVTAGFGPRQFQSSHAADEWLRHLLNAALAAVVVAFIEEFFFRGVLFGALRQSMNWRAALVISSVAYAFLHFFERPETPAQITWSTGLAFLPRMMRGFGDVEVLVPGVLNLFVAGALLALAYQRTGAVWFSIGLHAGWIFWLKTFGFMTTNGADAAHWFWGTDKLIDGWVCLPLLLATLPVVARLQQQDSFGPRMNTDASQPLKHCIAETQRSSDGDTERGDQTF